MKFMLIDDLIKQGYIKTPRIKEAFKKIKREDFLLEKDKEDAEINAPLPIGFEQTNSQPITVAFMIELLQPEQGDKILDVGSGSGWTTAILSQITGGGGKVYALEIVQELKKFGEINVSKYNFVNKGVAEFYYGDGNMGLPEHAPFDKILVSAASREVPKELLKQLKIGGCIVVPIGEPYGSQDLVLIEKISKDEYKEKRFSGFIFVPLVKK